MGVVGVPKSRLKQFGFRVKRELLTYQKELDACSSQRQEQHSENYQRQQTYSVNVRSHERVVWDIWDVSSVVPTLM